MSEKWPPDFEILIKENGAIAVKDYDLLHRLIQHPERTIASLSKRFATITLDEINVDEDGRVVFSNEYFSKVVTAQASGALNTNNPYCSNATISASSYPWVTGVANEQCTEITQDYCQNAHCH